jgi:hypothetical protein
VSSFRYEMSHESSSSESYGSDDTGESSSDDAIYDRIDPFLDCLRDIRANDDLIGRQEETELGTHPMVDFRGVDSENLLNDTIDPIRHESEQALSPEASKQQTPSEPVPTAPPMPVATGISTRPNRDLYIYRALFGRVLLLLDVRKRYSHFDFDSYSIFV